MKPPKFAYAAPETLAEALELLAEGGPDARLLAGGQSLVPAMNFRLARPSLLIDLGSVPGLRGLRRGDDGGLVAGPMTRHRDFERSALARELLPIAHAAMPNIAHLAIRNRGTIGGSLAHADPAGDWPALGLACNAKITVRSTSGTREVAARDFGRGLFETALQSGEMVSEIGFPRWGESLRWGLQKMARRRGDFAIVGVVVVGEIGTDEICSNLRIVVYGAADCACLVPEAQGVLEGRVPTAARVAEASRAAAGAIATRSDLHASAAYRTELIEALTQRALWQAFGEVVPAVSRAA